MGSRVTGNILILDDNRDAADSLAILLRSYEYVVISAYSAQEALESLDGSSNVRVVISDIRMPEVDGFDFLRVVKHRFPAIKVILMTGVPITDDDVIPRGATILTKPLDVDNLIRLLPQL